jgi:hypothetical protein
MEQLASPPFLIQVMNQHVLDPRACRAPLRVAITHQQGLLIAASGSRPPRRCSSLSFSSTAKRCCIVVSDGPSLTRRVNNQPASQPASRPVRLPCCLSSCPSLPQLAPAANHGFHHLRSHDTITKEAVQCSQRGMRPVHQHRDPSLSYCM